MHSLLRRVVSLAALTALAAAPALADFRAGLEAYARGDFATALLEWRPLAEAGLAEAQYNLGLLYQGGKGVAADPTAAHAWYLRAARSGYARAQYRVAEMYASGEGARADLIRALFWFRLAADRAYLDARKRRKQVARQMTPEQLAYAEMLLRHHRRDGTFPD